MLLDKISTLAVTGVIHDIASYESLEDIAHAIERTEVKVSLIYRYWGCDFPQLSMEICKFEVLKTD